MAMLNVSRMLPVQPSQTTAQQNTTQTIGYGKERYEPEKKTNYNNYFESLN